MFYIIIAIVFIPVLILYPTKIIGKKNVPKKGRVIFCANHQSNADSVLLITRFRRQKFLAKKELAKKPIPRWFLSTMGAIFVDRNNPGIEAYKKCINHLKKEKALTVFPEGTRANISDLEQMQMKNGLAMFALKTDSPIVPMVILNKPKLFRRNKIIVGKPFKLDKVEKVTKEELAKASEIISQKMQETKQNYLNVLEEKKNKKKRKNGKNS